MLIALPALGSTGFGAALAVTVGPPPSRLPTSIVSRFELSCWPSAAKAETPKSSTVVSVSETARSALRPPSRRA